MLLNILIFLFVLSILVISHEVGHFIAARLGGIRVEKFALGFGPPLIKFKLKETLFLICLIPLGGYVKLAGDERNSCKGANYEFFSKPVRVRANVIFFGPLFNLILAFFIFWIIYIFSGFPSEKAIVGEDLKYEFAAKSEFQPEELQKLKENAIVKEIDGDKRYVEVVWTVSELGKSELESIGFKESDIQRILHIWKDSLRIVPKTEFTKEELKELIDKNIVVEWKIVEWKVSEEEELRSKLSGIEGINSRHILDILKKSRYPAYKAGVREGDLILEVNGEELDNWQQMSRLIRKSENTVALTILRNGEKKEIEVVPKRVTVMNQFGELEKAAKIGIMPMAVKKSIVVSCVKAGQKLYNRTSLIVKGLFFIIVGKIPFKESISGVVGIYEYTSVMARVGMLQFFDFVAILSISLAVINLFPFPVLDGGHLLFLGLEKLRKKPLPQKGEDIITQIGVGVLVFFMLFLVYNDIIKIRRRNLTPAQLQKLEETRMVKKVDEAEKYVIWTAFTAEDLGETLSKTGISNREAILALWRDSVKIMEVKAR